MKSFTEFVALILGSLLGLMDCNDHLMPTPLVKGTGPAMLQKRLAVFAFLTDVHYSLVVNSEAALA